MIRIREAHYAAGMKLALLLLAVLAVHRARDTLWLAEPPYLWTDAQRTNVFPEFRGIVVFMVDFPLLALLILTLLRVSFVPSYRRRLTETLHLLVPLGGGWWAATGVCMLVGGLWAAFPNLAQYGALHLLAGLALAVIVADEVRGGSSELLATFILIGALCQTVLAFAQSLKQGILGLTWLGEAEWWVAHDLLAPLSANPPMDAQRAAGLAVNPNNLAGYLLIGLCAAGFLLYRRAQTARPLALPLFALLLTGYGLVATLSRAALLGAGMMVVLSALLLPRVRLRPAGVTLILSGVLAVALIGVGVITLGEGLIGRINSLGATPAPSDTTGSALAADDATRWLGRDFLWQYTAPVLREHWLTGVGANNLVLAIARQFPQLPRVLLPVHNAYLMIWAELGLVGLGLIVLALAALLRHLRRDASLVWASGLIGIGVVMTFDYYFWGDYPSRLMLLWVVGMWWGCRMSVAAASASSHAADP